MELQEQPWPVHTFLDDVDDVVGVEAELVRVLRVVGVERPALRHLRLGLGLRLGPPPGWGRPARGLPADTGQHSKAQWAWDSNLSLSKPLLRTSHNKGKRIFLNVTSSSVRLSLSQGRDAISFLCKWLSRYFPKAPQMLRRHLVQAEMGANVHRLFMHISVSTQLRLCLSPCPNVTSDLVFSIKNKVLAHRLATLPFLGLSCNRHSHLF